MLFEKIELDKYFNRESIEFNEPIVIITEDNVVSLILTMYILENPKSFFNNKIVNFIENHKFIVLSHYEFSSNIFKENIEKFLVINLINNENYKSFIYIFSKIINDINYNFGLIKEFNKYFKNDGYTLDSNYCNILNIFHNFYDKTLTISEINFNKTYYNNYSFSEINVSNNLEKYGTYFLNINLPNNFKIKTTNNLNMFKENLLYNQKNTLFHLYLYELIIKIFDEIIIKDYKYENFLKATLKSIKNFKIEKFKKHIFN